MKFIVHFKFPSSTSEEPTWKEKYNEMPPTEIKFVVMQYSDTPKFKIMNEFEKLEPEKIDIVYLVFAFEKPIGKVEDDLVLEYRFVGIEIPEDEEKKR